MSDVQNFVQSAENLGAKPLKYHPGIFDSASARKQLVQLLRPDPGQNDTRCRDFVADFLEGAAEEFEDAAGEIENSVDLLDRAGLAPAAAVAGGGIVAMVTFGGGAIFLLIGGAFALGVLGIGRTHVKAQARRQAQRAKKFRTLAAQLRGDK